MGSINLAAFSHILKGPARGMLVHVAIAPTSSQCPDEPVLSSELSMHTHSWGVKARAEV